MERGMILVFAVLMVYLASGVQGSHLVFSNNTQVNVTRAGCGVTKLCVETPDDCDPTANDTCLFGSVMVDPPSPPNGSFGYVGLRGYSMGYVAIGVSMNPLEGETTLFICGQNNSAFFFRLMRRNNTDGTLSSAQDRVTEIRGVVNGNVIRCEFTIPNVNLSRLPNVNTVKSTDLTAALVLGTGTVVGSSLGPFNASLTTGLLNIADPTSNVAVTTPTPGNGTTAGNGTTTGSSGAIQPHAVLLGATVLTLLAMLRV